MKEFAVVSFLEEDGSVGIIPTNWINDDLSSCKYPDNVKTDTKRQKMIISKSEPQDDWTTYRIRIFKTYSSFESAKEHVPSAELTSNLDSSCNEFEPVKRKRTKKTHRLPGEDSSDDDFSSPIFISTPIQKTTPSYPNPSDYFKPNTLQTHISPTPSEESSPTSSPCYRTNSSQLLVMSQRSQISPGLPNTCKPLNSPSTSQLRSRELLSYPGDSETHSNGTHLMWNVLDDHGKRLSSMENSIKSMENKLDQILKAVNSGSRSKAQSDGPHDDQPSSEIYKMLPLSKENFDEFEKLISSSSRLRQKLTRVLACVSGEDISVSLLVGNLLRKLLTDDLAETYSLTGKQVKQAPTKKKKFEITHTYQLVFDLACRSSKDAPKESRIREAISDWLMQAKFRRSRREARMARSSTELREDSVGEILWGEVGGEEHF